MPVTESKIKIVIVDDEREACDNLKSMLEQCMDSDIRIAGIANDTVDAEKLINAVDPDVVFLDIEMQDENAFQFLDRVYPYKFDVIFVTAYDEYAIKALKLNAVDYILKPICVTELSNSLIKLKERVNHKFLIRNTGHEVNALKEIAGKQHQNKIVLRDMNNIEVVEFKNLYYIEGDGSYCNVFFTRDNQLRKFIVCTIISEYEELLPDYLFYRVHKSFIINCRQISRILCDANYEILLKNKVRIPVSRRRYSNFIRFLKDKNIDLE